MHATTTPRWTASTLVVALALVALLLPGIWIDTGVHRWWLTAALLPVEFGLLLLAVCVAAKRRFRCGRCSRSGREICAGRSGSSRAVEVRRREERLHDSGRPVRRAGVKGGRG